MADPNDMSEEEKKDEFVEEMINQWNDKTGELVSRIEEGTDLDTDEVLLYIMFNQMSDIHNSVMIEIQRLQQVLAQGLPGGPSRNSSNKSQGGNSGPGGGIIN